MIHNRDFVGKQLCFRRDRFDFTIWYGVCKLLYPIQTDQLQMSSLLRGNAWQAECREMIMLRSIISVVAVVGLVVMTAGNANADHRCGGMGGGYGGAGYSTFPGGYGGGYGTGYGVFNPAFSSYGVYNAPGFGFNGPYGGGYYPVAFGDGQLQFRSYPSYQMRPYSGGYRRDFDADDRPSMGARFSGHWHGRW